MRKQFFLLLLTVIFTIPVSSQVFYIDANLPPVLMAEAGDDNFIDHGDSVQIGGNPSAIYGYGYYSYYWEPVDGLSDPTQANPWAKPGETTTYTLTVSDGHHCVAIDEVTVKVGASGLDDLENNLKIDVFPNPAGEFVNIRISGQNGRIKLKILNSLGQGLLEEEAVQQQDILFNFDTRNWNKGIYHLLVQTTNRVETKVIVIL